MVRLFTPEQERQASSLESAKNTQRLKYGVLEPKSKLGPANKGSPGQTAGAKVPARKPTPAQAEEQKALQKEREEMQAVIQATLACRGGCCSPPTEEGMEADTSSGLYDRDRDLVYGVPDEGLEVGPLDARKPSRPGYFTLANTEQLAILKAARDFLSPFKCYTFFRHIYQHKLIQSGFIRNMCQDREDINQVRSWSWAVSMQDTDGPKPERRYRQSNWPYGSERVKAEIRVWSSERAKRKERRLRTCIRWYDILAEREKQRQEYIKRMGPDFDDGSFTPQQTELILMRLGCYAGREYAPSA